MNVLDKAGLIRLWTHIKVALNQMLTQAKESGEFDGESVTITDISESTVSGYNNVVTFSDGTTLTVKNGLPGENGYSIYSNSTEPMINPDGGLEYNSTDADLLDARTGDFVLCTSNYTLYKIIGETAEAFFVQALCNLKGADGYTPVKGTDYFTDSDKQEIADLVDVTDWFGAGTSIPSGADLDAYTTEGKYHVSSTAISNTIVNAPITGTNYALFVFVRTNGKSRTQMVITLSNKMFLRSATSTGIYGAWVEVGSASAPVRGEDYWTEEDKAEIKSYVDEAILGGVW